MKVLIIGIAFALQGCYAEKRIEYVSANPSKVLVTLVVDPTLNEFKQLIGIK